jgi:hypothetical protein
VKIHGIIWLEEIVEKLEQKHSVFQKEIVECGFRTKSATDSD